MIAVIDYGMGNIHSVCKALELYGAQIIVTDKPKDVRASDKVVLPGVGAFDDAMAELRQRNLISVLVEHIRNNKIFLGICLGMQLLFEESQEGVSCKGLSVLQGEVVKFPSPARNEDGLKLKIPHMGWDQLRKQKKNCPLLKDISERASVYFCHSYYPLPVNADVVAATCDYIREFTAVVWKDNIYGVQFHPEKSQDIGLGMIKNFVNLQ